MFVVSESGQCLSESARATTSSTEHRPAWSSPLTVTNAGSTAAVAQTSTAHLAGFEHADAVDHLDVVLEHLAAVVHDPGLPPSGHPVGAGGVDLVEVDPPHRCPVLDGGRRMCGDGGRVGPSEHRPDQHPMTVRRGQRSPELTGDVRAVSHPVELPGLQVRPDLTVVVAGREQLATQHDHVREIDGRVRRHGPTLHRGASRGNPPRRRLWTDVRRRLSGVRRRPGPGGRFPHLEEVITSSKCRFPRSSGETGSPHARYRSTYASERRPRSRCQARYAATRPLASLRCRGSAASHDRPVAGEQRAEQRDGLGCRAGRARDPAGRAQHAAHRRVEPPVRAPRSPQRAQCVERRRVAGDRQRAQQVGVEDLAGPVLPGRHRPQAADEQQELLDRRAAAPR